MEQPSIFFISDLHLDLTGKNSALLSRFLDFLAHNALKSNALYILGDLFDAYVGELPTTHVGYVNYQKIINALHAYTKTGRQLFLMRGNRDFLMQPHLTKKTGGILINDPHLMDLSGHKTLLTHGDRLSTGQKIYPWYRLLAQQAITQRLFLSLPFRLRETIAALLKSDPSNPCEALVLPNRSVRALLEAYQADWIIHGHFHTQYVKAFPRISLTAQQWSLGAWDETGCVLEATPQGICYVNLKGGVASRFRAGVK